MISFYRIYFDQRLANFTGLKYIFIYEPLSTQEISQADLATFINDHSDSVSFKCVLNKNIYAIVRYIPAKEEMRIPIEAPLLFDLFIFPSPIQNKIPAYISSTSIKTMQPFAVKHRVNILDQFTYSKIDTLIKGKDDKQAGIEGQYKKVYGGLFNILAPSDYDKLAPSSWYSYKYMYHTVTESPFHKLTVENLILKNVCRVPLRSYGWYEMVHNVRSIDSTVWNAMSTQQKIATQVDFDLPKKRFLSFLNPSRNSELNPYLRSQWQYSRSNEYYFQSNYYYNDCMMIQPYRYATNIYLLMDHQLGYANTSYYASDLTMINLFDSTDMSSFPYEYLNDSTHYSTYNKIDLQETQSPLTFVDSSISDEAKDRIWKLPSNYLEPQFDATTRFFNDLYDVSATWCDNTSNWTSGIGGRIFTITDKQLRVRADRESMLAPVWSKAYGFRDYKECFSDSEDRKYYVVYTIRYLKKESLDWMVSNDFTMQYKWFFDHLADVTEIKYNQHWYAFELIFDSTGGLKSKQKMYDASVTDQAFFDFSRNETGMINYWSGSSQRLIYNYNDPNIKFMLSKCTTMQNMWSENSVTTFDSATKIGYEVTCAPQRFMSTFTFPMESNDYTMQKASDFSYQMPTTMDRKWVYKVSSSEFDSTDISNCDAFNFPELDATHIAPLDLMQSFTLGYEDQAVVNLLPSKTGTVFAFRDCFTVSPISASSDKLYQTQQIYKSVWAICTTGKITDTLSDGKQLKWFFDLSDPYERAVSPCMANSYSQTDDYVSLSYYRDGDVYVGGQSKWLLLNDATGGFYLDDVNGNHNNGYLQDLDGVLDHSDITAQSDPSGTGYIYDAMPNKGYDQLNLTLYEITSVIFDSYETYNSQWGLLSRNTYNWYQWTTDYTYSQNIQHPVDGGIAHGQSNAYDGDYVGLDSWSRFNDHITAMSPFDLLIHDSTTYIRRQTNAWFSQSPVDLTCTTVDIDSSTIFPQTMIWKMPIAHTCKLEPYDYSTSETGYFNDIVNYNLLYSFGWLSKSQKSQCGIPGYCIAQNIRDLRIDETTWIAYADRQGHNNLSGVSTSTYTYNSSITTNAGNDTWFHHRTPSVMGVGTDTSFDFCKQNAIFDMFLYHCITDKTNGQIVPKLDRTQVDLDNTTLSFLASPIWNKIRDKNIDITSISLTSYGDRLYQTPLTDITQITIDPSIVVKFNGDAPYTRNIGYPVIQLTDHSLAITDGTSKVLRLDEAARKQGFEHCATIDVSNEMKSTDYFYTIIDHSCNVEFDFEDNTLAMIQTKPDVTIVNNQLYCDYEKRIVYLADFTSDYTNQTNAAYSNDMYYCSKNSPDYSSASDIWDAAVPMIDDYTFENNTATASTDQSTKYLMTRIKTSEDYIIKSTDLPVNYGAPTSTYFTKYTPSPSKGELIQLIAALPSNKMMVINLKSARILIDGSSKDAFYVIFNLSSTLIGFSEHPISYLTTILPSRIGSSQLYFSDVYILEKQYKLNVQISAGSWMELSNNYLYQLDACKAATAPDPLGNMYLISDFDNDLLEAVFVDLIK